MGERRLCVYYGISGTELPYVATQRVVLTERVPYYQYHEAVCGTGGKGTLLPGGCVVLTERVPYYQEKVAGPRGRERHGSASTDSWPTAPGTLSAIADAVSGTAYAARGIAYTIFGIAYAISGIAYAMSSTDTAYAARGGVGDVRY